MSRVMTFSTVFPSYHPRAGQPTHFIEKIYNSLYSRNNLMDYPEGLEVDESICERKAHTIRAGHRWKVGDKFSPRVWSGKPYNSKQITIGPDIEIKKIWDFEAIGTVEPFYLGVRVSDVLLYEIQSHQVFLGGREKLQLIAENDGLTFEDFQDWFRFGESIHFKGQILCWNDSIKY